MLLTAEAIARYRAQGYLLVENAIPPDVVAQAQRTTDEMIEASRALHRSDEVYDLEDTHAPHRPRVRRIKQPHKVHESYRAIGEHPHILDIVEQLVGPDIRLLLGKLNRKPPEGGEAVEWHQDWAFYPHTNDDHVIVGVMLEDCVEENGPLMVIPGSHTGPIHDHTVDGYFCGAMDLEACGVDAAKAVALTGRAGSITLHHVRTIHGSRPNLSPRSRHLMLFSYAAADSFPLAKAYDGGSFADNIVRGRATTIARMKELPVRMPYPPAPSGDGSIFERQRMARGRSFG
jgi:phytanoyl-CoA hydroxylase